jgi:hypothetical protein
MYRSALILSAVFGCTNIALVQTVAQAKTKVEIGRLAKSITLRIETVGSESRGSGVVLQKQGDVYTVITAAHVLSGGSSFRLITPDGKVHQSLSFKKANSNLDLAVVKFRSSNSYPLAEIGTSVSLESGSEIYVAGFPAATSTFDDGVFNFTRGEVTGNASKPNRSGYSLIYRTHLGSISRVEYSKNAIFKQLDRQRMGDYQGTPTAEETDKATYLEQMADPRMMTSFSCVLQRWWKSIFGLQ